MPYCSDCGTQLREKVSTCYKCGSRNVTGGSSSQGIHSVAQSKREEVYDGTIHKCPICGNVINGYTLLCERCGYEVREKNTADSIDLLLNKIEEKDYKHKDLSKFDIIIASMGLQQSPNNIAYRESISSKANVIANYPIPNTKESILEFMILAASNLTPDLYKTSSLEIRGAWISKMEQAYNKAKISFGNDPVYEEIQQIHLSKKKDIKIYENEIKNDGKKDILIALLILVLIFGIFGMFTLVEHVQEKKEKKNIQIELTRLEELTD